MEKPGRIRIINEKEVRSLLDMSTVIGDVETALKEHAEGRCINPVKLHMPLRPEIDGYLNSMPACLKDHNVMGAKLVSVYKDNLPKFGLPATIGTIVLNDPESGMPFAILDGTAITSLRTGAAVGVGAKYAAAKGARVMLQVGTGAQGLMAAHAVLTAVPGIEEVRASDLSEESLKNFARIITTEFPKVSVRAYSDYREAIHGSQIICAATTSPKPLMRGMKFDKGTAVLLIADMMDNSDLKSYDRCLVDYPECFCIRFNEDLGCHAKQNGTTFEQIELSTFHATIGEVIAGLKPARTSDDDIIAVGFVGMGIEDVLVAKTAYDRAVEKNIGKVLDFTCM